MRRHTSAFGLFGCFAFAVAIGGTVLAQAPALPVPPAPAPGSSATYKSAKDLADVLKAAAANPGGMTSSAVSNTDQYRINVVHRVRPAGVRWLAPAK